MVDIIAIILALILPALAVFWRIGPERFWMPVARFAVGTLLFWFCMAGAQYYDVAARVSDGRAHDMAEASSMAGYFFFGPEFWLFPGVMYVTALSLARWLWLRVRLLAA